MENYISHYLRRFKNGFAILSDKDFKDRLFDGKIFETFFFVKYEGRSLKLNPYPL